MQFQDIIKELEHIENNYSVNEWKVESIRIWPVLRISIRNQILYKYNQNTYNEGVLGKSSSILTYFISVVKSFFYTLQATLIDFINNDRIRGNYDVAFHTVIQDRVLLDSCYYNRLCDPLIDQITEKSLRSIVFESSPLSIKYKYPRYRKSRYIQFFLNIVRIKSYFKLKLNIKVNNLVNLEGYDKLENYVSVKYGISIWSIDKIVEQTDLLFALKDYYRRILLKAKVKLAIITMYYSVDGMAFVLACKELGIVSCDLQHGVQGDFHVSYGLWNNVPTGGYEILPRYFLSWSDFEADAIKKWNKEVSCFHAPVIIGNLFIKKWKDDNDPHVAKYDRIISQIKEGTSPKTHVLFTLQDYSISDWLLDSFKSAGDDFFWWIRMHPEQIQYESVTAKLIRDKGIKNFNITDASSLPLYAILRNINIHLTGWSTTILEAKEFMVASIITDKLGEEMYSEEIKKGNAYPVYDKSSFLKLLEILKKQEKYKIPNSERVLVTNEIPVLKKLLEIKDNI